MSENYDGGPVQYTEGPAIPLEVLVGPKEKVGEWPPDGFFEAAIKAGARHGSHITVLRDGWQKRKGRFQFRKPEGGYPVEPDLVFFAERVDGRWEVWLREAYNLADFPAIGLEHELIKVAPNSWRVDFDKPNILDWFHELGRDGRSVVVPLAQELRAAGGQDGSTLTIGTKTDPDSWARYVLKTAETWNFLEQVEMACG